MVTLSRGDATEASIKGRGVSGRCRACESVHTPHAAEGTVTPTRTNFIHRIMALAPAR